MARNRDEVRWDRDTIYTGPAKDHQGHSTNLRVHIPDDWAATISEVVSGPDFPEYKGKINNFVRDAVIHRLADTNEMKGRASNPTVVELIKVARMNATLQLHEHRRAEFRELDERFESVVRDAMYDQNYDLVGHLIEAFEGELEHLTEPYRSKLAAKLEYFKMKVVTR